jgi:hypothetical protein
MTPEEASLSVFDAMAALDLPYMVVGSLSSNIYGIPRSTKDADLVVEFGTSSPAEFARRLGSGFRLEPQMSFETVTRTMRSEFEVVGEAFKIEVFQVVSDPHDRAGSTAASRPRSSAGRSGCRRPRTSSSQSSAGPGRRTGTTAST